MKISLVFGPNDKESAVSLLRLFQEIEIDSSAFQIGTHWASAGKDLVDQLDKSTHVIVLVSDSSLLTPWFPFVVGYISGRLPKGILYHKKTVQIPDPYISTLVEFSDQETLKTHFSDERNIWYKQEKINDAKTDLVETGIGITNENFALCVVQGNTTAVNNFLILGFSPDTENAKGVPLLILSIRNHHSDIVTILLQHGADVNKKSGDRGNTALMDATVSGNLEIVRELLDAGADINCKSKNGQTALMLAVGEGKTTISEELINRGADLSITDNLGMSAKKYAELFKQTSILEMIQKK